MTKQFIKSLPKMTTTQIERLKSEGRVVIVYPRKKLVVVDGFKKFQAA